MNTRTRWILLAALGAFLAFVLLDSMGTFDDKSKTWYEVPHGSHSHYLPKDCDPPLDVGQGPTTRPGPDETVDCQGRIVKITQ